MLKRQYTGRVLRPVLHGALALSLAAIAAAQPPLPMRELTAGIHLIHAEVADTDATREQGLMHRESLPPNHGMLFVFDRPAIQCFWMRNTLVPLSVAFLGEDGRVVNIADMAPRTDTAHCAAEPVRYALEMEQGWFASRGIGQAGKIAGLPE